MTIFLGAFPDLFFPTIEAINKALIFVAVFIGDSEFIVLVIEIVNIFHAVDIKLNTFFAVADLNDVFRALSQIVCAVLVFFLLRVLRRNRVFTHIRNANIDMVSPEIPSAPEPIEINRRRIFHCAEEVSRSRAFELPARGIFFERIVKEFASHDRFAQYH